MRVGILGGGQLARMLAEAALGLGHQPVVLARANGDPADIDGVELSTGALDDDEALAHVFGRCDVVTTENEWVDAAAIRRAMASAPGVAFLPPLEGIAVAQDKLAQKQLFTDLGVATAPWHVLDPDAAGIAQAMAPVAERFPRGVVLKWSRFGYDGRGNHVVRDPRGCDEAALAAIAAFVDAGRAKGAEVYAEAFVPFEREVAMVMARRLDGVRQHFPLVESRQERGVCREVVGPATALGVPAALEADARRVMDAVGDRLGMVGVFAVEFFVTESGELLANEMAPRVHNTGHYSRFDGDVNQFDLHVQAVLGLELSEPAFEGLVVMRNLLGPWTLEGRRPQAPPSTDPAAGVELVWYGKAAVGAGRKMGHLTARAVDQEDLGTVLAALEGYEDALWREGASA